MRSVLRSAVLLALVLFLVAGGAALAGGRSVTHAAAKCGLGGVRGIAYVTGGSKGVGNLSGSWSGSAELFGYRWNCSGGAVLVRKPDTSPTGFDVRFVGNPAQVAVASAATAEPAAASVSRNPDGSFHVTIGGQVSGKSFPERPDLSFVVIAF